MKVSARVAALLFFAVVVGAIIFVGTSLESSLLKFSQEISEKSSLFPVTLFYAVVSGNVILLFLFLFLTFRNGVKLAVDRRHGVFGSSLRTRLVTSFLFFSLLPTIVLLYISTKFVNANFERWLPSTLVATTQQSLASEGEYQRKILDLLSNVKSPSKSMEGFDFVATKSGSEIKLTSRDPKLDTKIIAALHEHANQITRDPVWLSIDKNERIAVRKDEGGQFIGIISPPLLHPQWELLSKELSLGQPEVQIFRVSYYVMLGVVTMLILFSATWLGFTLARELTTPLQVLAGATELVAQGSYAVKIDDIVADDEIGRLALSFRSMVYDLRTAKEEADRSALEIQRKADELQEQSEYNAVLLRNVNAAVIALDERGNIEAWNEQTERLFKRSEREVVGRTLAAVLEPEFYEGALSPLLGALHGNEKRSASDWVGRVAGAEYQFHILVSAVVSSKGRAGQVIFINDVTELAKAQRQAAWRDVARRIAHEIKNPLTPIKLGAQRLERRFQHSFSGDDAEVFAESLQVIQHSTESIRRLVDEFVRIARMPAAVFRKGNLLDPIKMALASFQENSERLVVRLELDLANWSGATQNSEPVLIAEFDSDHIVRLFNNLIANAIAASAECGDEVVVCCAFNARAKALVVQVKDWGIGVPEGMKSKIFEPYFSTKRTGTGLGLVIVRQIVEEHRGHISLEGNVPRGSIFTVEIPLV